MLTFVFPGQGSQKKGMGESLFDEYKGLTEKADAILGYSIKELCLEDSKNSLQQTQFTQPALYVVNALSYLKKIDETLKKPDFVAGHSLGEYNALFAAEAFDFETGLRMVQKRGELMSKASNGGMAAVIGSSEEDIKKILQENDLKNINIANFNSPGQIVISGLKEEIELGKSIFKKAGVKTYIPLKVSGAFHSPLMEPASEEFKAFIESFKFSELKIQVVSNVHARPYKSSEIKKNLVDQITHPVKWTDSICYLMGKGEMIFEEIGPGKVLTGLIQKIQKEAAPLVIEDEKENTEISPATSEKISEPDSVAAVKDITVTEKEVKALKISADRLGNAEFMKDYNIKYAYIAGAMYKGIASKEMVVKMGKAKLLAFLGTGGVSIEKIEQDLKYIQKELKDGESYGLNLLHHPWNSTLEENLVDLYLKYGVKNVEAAAFMQMTPSIVRYRLTGLEKGPNGGIICRNKIEAKLSRPEVAEIFLSPAPMRIVEKLLQNQKVTKEQAELSQKVPMADDICAEADSGGHTDRAVAFSLLPAIMTLRDTMMIKYGYEKRVRVGAAGGIGTPGAAAAAFIMGADFILTGSINQCTVEAGTSDSVKDMLQTMNVQDTAHAPAGDMFELGSKVQVLRKGLFFPARANKLYELYKRYNSIDEIDEKTKSQIQEKYFCKSFEEVYKETKDFLMKENPREIEQAEKNPKHKMALIFRWYFGYSTQIALNGDEDRKVDYQVHCGPALGSFNQWVQATNLENWRNRHVDEIADKLMNETALLLNKRFDDLMKFKCDG